MGEIAVVGGAGFIGTRLVGVLEGALVVDKNAADDGRRRFHADVRDRRRLTEVLKGVETLYLLAAEHADDVEPSSLYYDVNVGGAENVVEAAIELGISRIIFTSSVAVYGLAAPGATEGSPADPFNDYGKSKWLAEQRLVAWAEEEPSRSLVIIRPCVVFGEGNRGNVYNLLRQLDAGRFLMVGKGTNRKSMAYVGNLAEFMAGFVGAPSGIQMFNYADKPDLSMNRLLQVAADEMELRPPRLALPYPVGVAAGYAFDLLSRLTGRRLPLSAVRVKKFCADTTVSTERLASTGFVAPYSIEEGLRRMINVEFPRHRSGPSVAQG